MSLTTGAVLLTVSPSLQPICCGCRRPAPLELCRACSLEADVRSRFVRCGHHRYRLGSYARAGDDTLGPRTTAIATALGRFKYAGDRLTGHRLARLFGRYAVAIDRCYDLIVPVPLHPRRLRHRGFNQAAWLARAASRTMRLPLQAAALHRTVESSPQAGLGAAQRRRMTGGAFATRARLVRQASILLVDDVMTTGSTAAAAMASLLAAGAARVDLAVLLLANRRSVARPHQTSREPS